MENISQESIMSDDDDADEEALRLAALKSLAVPKYINTANLISIVPINTITPLPDTVIKLEPISPTREQKFFEEKLKKDVNPPAIVEDEETETEEEVTDEEPDPLFDDSLDKLLDQFEAEIEGKVMIDLNQKRKKKIKVKRKRVVAKESFDDDEVELVDAKFGKRQDAGPVINVRESITPEVDSKPRSRHGSRSPVRSRSPRSDRRRWTPSRSRSRSRSRFRGRRTRSRSWSPSPSYSPKRWSPRRRSRSPYRSPIRRVSPRRSRSPARQFRPRSRSPRLRSRTPPPPLRRTSRSPLPALRGRSRSPNRSPLGGRSPARLRSPLRVPRRSPLRGLSPRRSPHRPRSRTPLRQRNVRSPVRQGKDLSPPRGKPARSPIHRRNSLSPKKRRSLSPVRPALTGRRRSTSPARPAPVRRRSSSPGRPAPPRRRSSSPGRNGNRRHQVASREGQEDDRRRRKPGERPPPRRSPYRQRPVGGKFEASDNNKIDTKVNDDKKVVEDKVEEPLDPILEARRKKFASVPNPHSPKSISLKAVIETIQPIDEDYVIDTRVDDDFLFDDSEDSDGGEGRFKGALSSKPRVPLISLRGIRDGKLEDTSRLDEALPDGDDSRYRRDRDGRGRGRGSRIDLRIRDNRRPQEESRRSGEARKLKDDRRMRENGRKEKIVIKDDGRESTKEDIAPVDARETIRLRAEKKREQEQAAQVEVPQSEPGPPKSNSVRRNSVDFDELASVFERELMEGVVLQPAVIEPKLPPAAPAQKPRITVKKDLFAPAETSIAPKPEKKKSPVSARVSSVVVNDGDEDDGVDLRAILAQRRKERKLVNPQSRLVHTALQGIVQPLEPRANVRPKLLLPKKKSHKLPLPSLNSLIEVDPEEPRPKRRVRRVEDVDLNVIPDAIDAPAPKQSKPGHLTIKRTVVTVASKVCALTWLFLVTVSQKCSLVPRLPLSSLCVTQKYRRNCNTLYVENCDYLLLSKRPHVTSTSVYIYFKTSTRQYLFLFIIY